MTTLPPLSKKTRFQLWTVTFGILFFGMLSMARFYVYYGRLLNGWDAQFYYATARSFLFNHTTDITAALKQTPWTRPFDRDGDGVMEAVPLKPNGEFQSKYPIGLPLAECLLLALAYVIRRALESIGFHILGPPGLSLFEIAFVAQGLWWFTVYGLNRLGKFCTAWSHVDRWHWPIVVALLGTTLFYYSAMFPFMVHCLGFTVTVLWLIEIKGLTEDSRSGYHLAMLGAYAGLLFLIRPQQVLLPLLSTPWIIKPLLKEKKMNWLPGAAVGILCSLAAIAATLWYNKTQFGVYTLNGYAAANEHFDFLHPKIYYVLFGIERGLFYYSPIVLLSIPGIITIWRKDKLGWIVPVILNAIAQIFLVAAWWCPSQGDAFGLRMWTENVPLVAMGLSATPARFLKKGWPFALGCSACILWSFFLLFRYNHWT